MKPYIVEMTIRAVVMADDSDHAFIVARTQFRDIARDETPDVFVDDEVRSEDDLPEGWDLGCLPYGGDGNTRLGEIISTEPDENDDTCRFCDGQGEVQGQGSAPDIDPPIKKCNECNGSGKASYYRTAAQAATKE